MSSYFEPNFIENIFFGKVVFQILAKKSKWCEIKIGYLAAILKGNNILIFYIFQNYDFF